MVVTVADWGANITEDWRVAAHHQVTVLDDLTEHFLGHCAHVCRCECVSTGDAWVWVGVRGGEARPGEAHIRHRW